MSDKRVYELVEYECLDGDCLMINEKTHDSKLGALSPDHRSIGEAIVVELNLLSEENDSLKKELHDIYELVTVTKAINVLEKEYDKLLIDADAYEKRQTILECMGKLDDLRENLL